MENQDTLKKITQEAESKLEIIDSSPFSPQAFSLLKEKISEYILELVSESINVSKRHQADMVSCSHVQHAWEYLISNTKQRFFKHIGTIGGIILGASSSNILSMYSGVQYTSEGTFNLVVMSIIGAILVTLHMSKD
jgi:hypothetical protein